MDTRRVTRFWRWVGVALLALAVVPLLIGAPNPRAQTDNFLYESSAHAGPHRASLLP